MATQIYCERRDIVDIIGEAGLLTCIDDNADGKEDPEETVYVTNAIKRSASEMNHSLGRQYSPLTHLIGNEWCKWCNAYIAAYYLQSRRSNSPSASVMEAVIQYRQQLEDIRWGRDKVPEASPTHNSQPAVSNFIIRHNDADGPILVDPNTSTGGNPVPGVTRRVGGLSNFF